MNQNQSAASATAITNYELENGLQIVVIEDHRTPVVTHMVWYKNGSADDPIGKSGIAHFLEHLMFKGTEAHPKGEFSNIVAELGGQENAFTSVDYTAYYQRVAKEHLSVMMGFEADRMVNLVLSEDDVNPEREVVLEERRMRTDSDPGAQLQESIGATLFTHHPYGTPIIGWEHEIKGLMREDALDYYTRFYTPENAILIVAGDILPVDVKKLAEMSYGKIPRRNLAPSRVRTLEPAPRTARRVSLADAKVEQPVFQQAFLVPTYRLSENAKNNDAEALDVLCQLLGGSSVSRLYKALVLDAEMATNVGCWYMSTALDRAQFMLYGVPREGVSLEALEAASNAVLADLGANLVPSAELERAKTRLMADVIYAQDNQTSLARIYGTALTTGSSIASVVEWPDMIEAVSAEDVRRVAAQYLNPHIAVTGYLLKAA
jgi:zinc protease